MPPLANGAAPERIGLPLALGLALALVSAAALAYEILLTRLFSIIQWHHFAYMMISVALLGYGAAGTAVTLLRARLEPHFVATFAAAAGAFGVTAVACFLAAQRLPFNALEFLWDWRQPLWLLAIYLLLFVPFFFAAICVCLTFTRFAAQAHRTYSFDILGGAAGSLGVILALYAMSPATVLGCVAAAALSAAACVWWFAGERPRLAAALPIALAVIIVLAMQTPLAQLRVSEYKQLSQALNVMGARVVAERSSPLGLVTVVESPEAPLRHAPGLSLSAPNEPPAQLGVFTDGDGLSALIRFDGRLESLNYLDYLTSALPYHLARKPHVLVLGAGAGGDVLQALYHRAARVDAVELNPKVVDLVERQFAGFSGRPYSQPGVSLHIGEARGFVAAGRERYDIIQVALLDSFGASSAGLHALSESFLYTVEAMQRFMAHLAPDGVLSITRWVNLPPRDTLKLFATAVVALERDGVRDPAARIVLIRSWKTATLVVKNGEVTTEDIARLREFCRLRGFDLVWYPGMHPEEADRYNRLDRPYFHEGAVALLGPQRDNFIERYKFDIAPATDDRPYFFNFFRWKTLPELLRLKDRGGLPLLEWGYPLVVATFAQALLVSAVLILLPLVWSHRAKPEDRRAGRLRTAAYFAALGTGFMFVEIAFIQKFVLFLSHPLYAVAVVLFAFLLSAGLGSMASQRVARLVRGELAPIALPVIAIVLLIAGYLLALPGMFETLIGLPDAVRIALTVLLILPLGMCMGMPFPLGLQALSAQAPQLVPWAWGINACTSVTGAVLATLLAIHLGFTSVLCAAAALYVLAVAVFPRRTRLQGC